MITLWRISDHIDLEGNGGRFFASRWSSRGRRIVYLAESPAGAMLEILAHLPFRSGRLPREYTLLQVHVPERCTIKTLEPSPQIEWRNDLAVTQTAGDAWMASGKTSLARVPSAIMPRTWNLLLNPEHPDAPRITIGDVVRERFDNRLFHFGAR
jgi:RES domain-containing protein